SFYVDWLEIQADTISFLDKALQSKNHMNLIIANSLHRIFPTLKIGDYAESRGEDSFVHDVFAPLHDVIFSLDINIKHFWANAGLTNENKDIKPDFGISSMSMGLSSRFVVLVAEFKLLDNRRKLENNNVKIGKEMKILRNELLRIGVEDPVVSIVLVMDNHIYLSTKYILMDPKFTL
ncbi:hypothetical protein INT45_007425, partial [Circinella minor]